ncbi:MAG: fasciclin domain-containing protein [Burkholderiales bacterium]|nr:fasciclin domain-containing protein [Phycisphaerae bacterium]
MIRNIRSMLCAAAMGCSAFGTISLVTSPAFAQVADHGDMKDMKPKDIIETAAGPGMTEVTTVVAAIKAADLVETLKGKGPFTVFAPTNAAFAKLPAGTVENLLKPENKEKLKSILLYHVHAGAAIKAADVKTMSLSTANGAPLAVKLDGSNVMINGAKVIKTDVVASNGIIHWIDTVVMPPMGDKPAMK